MPQLAESDASKLVAKNLVLGGMLGTVGLVLAISCYVLAAKKPSEPATVVGGLTGVLVIAASLVRWLLKPTATRRAAFREVP